MVTFISDIMQDASSQLENMKITTDDSDTIYSFTLPGETASYYFSRIIEQASMNTEELKHVTGSVDSLKLKCRLNKKGVLTEQSANASGTVSKSIFTIPVTLTETTSFMIPQNVAAGAGHLLPFPHGYRGLLPPAFTGEAFLR